VCCAPIAWLDNREVQARGAETEEAAPIARTVDAIGAQLRLPFKVGRRL
jgi:hypothetical protein